MKNSVFTYNLTATDTDTDTATDTDTDTDTELRLNSYRYFSNKESLVSLRERARRRHFRLQKESPVASNMHGR
ncbi:MAG: hypothetical protein ABW166_07075 [Sedimenticola sp.]